MSSPADDGRTLPWRILGRAVRPYALAVNLATMLAAVQPLVAHNRQKREVP